MSPLRPETPGDAITGGVPAGFVVEWSTQRTLLPVRAVLVLLTLADGSEHAFALPPEAALSLAEMLSKHGGIIMRKRQADQQ